mgnify:CR=1 FL=1
MFLNFGRKWEELINLKNARRYSEDTKSIISTLNGSIDNSKEKFIIGEIIDSVAKTQ